MALVAFLFASQVMFSDDMSSFDPGREKDFTDRLDGLRDRLADVEACALRVPCFSA
ncbi:MAG: hypothetical protein NT080_11210 [Spirochaetes bacterium]|nr:hypothetical protein [Spirochaetota bacterium]